MSVRNHVKPGSNVPRVADIAKRVGCIVAALKIARAPNGLPIADFRPDVLAVLESSRFIAVRAGMAIITGVGRDVMVAYDRANRIGERRQAQALDMSGMQTSGNASHDLSGEVKGRHAGRSSHLDKCWECGAEASTPCRNMDNEVTLQSCPGRRTIVDRRPLVDRGKEPK